MIFILSAFLMIGFSGFENGGNNVQGDWVLVEVEIGESISYPGFYILNFNGSNVSLYNDLELKSELKLVFSSNKLYYNGVKFGEIRYVDETQLLLLATVETKEGAVPAVFKYVPLVSTKVDENLDGVNNYEYEYEDNGRKHAFSFDNEKMLSSYGDEISFNSINRYELKKVKSTFFLATYLSKSLQSAIPVSEITSEYIELFAIPNGPDSVTAFKVKN